MTGPEQPLALAPLMADQLQRWLDSERGARDRSDHTIKAYQGDLLAFLSFLGRHQGGPALPATLGSLTQTDMRAFAASERARGLGAACGLAAALRAQKPLQGWSRGHGRHLMLLKCPLAAPWSARVEAGGPG